MDSTLAADMKAAIEKNLPAEVSKVLQDRLANVDALEKQVASLQHENSRLKKLELQQDALLAHEGALNNREAELRMRDVKLQVAEAKAELYKEMMIRHEAVVLAVFANATFKYSERGSIPFAGQNGGYPVSGHFERQVETTRGS